MTDEELQDKVEKGMTPGGTDEQAYRRVFDALKKEPNFILPSSFASTVMSRIRLAPKTSNELAWMYVGIFGLMIAAVVAVVLTDFKLNFGAFKFISGYPGLIIFGVLFILALQWVDRRFIKKMI